MTFLMSLLAGLVELINTLLAVAWWIITKMALWILTGAALCLLLRWVWLIATT